jgi:hypothetical protein
MPVRDLTVFGLLSAFGATAIISFWWALWHAPIDLTQGFALPGAGALVARQIWTFPITIILTSVSIRVVGSLLPPLVLHTTIDSFSDFVISEPGRYPRAMQMFFVLALIVAVVVADPRFRKGHGGSPGAAGG